MTRLEAYRHFAEDRPFVNCASAVIHALSPQLPRSATTQAVLGYNAQSLIDIAACISVEHARVGQYTALHAMRNDASAPLFFRDVQKQVNQSNDGGSFIGGLIATLEKGTELHVVGIMKHHYGRQNMFSVCDTARPGGRDLVRRMTYREMDARLIGQGLHNDYRALALVGYPLEVIEKNPAMHGDFSAIEHEMLMTEYRLYESLDRVGLLHLVQNGQ